MFNVFKKVLEQKPITKEDANKVSLFLLNRWLSGDNRLVELAATLNSLPGKQDVYTILVAIQSALQGKIKFIKFPAKSKDEIEQDQNIEILSKFFKVSNQEAIEYLEFYKNYPAELETIKQICKDLR